ncbi:hypothetical protein E5Q_01264 [Mixia osmundae IAM 14324]|uniref:Phospholipid/glycerol acyltransferase domain-containing protein n=1 Tax=Mixia osmundae (strain CBS 9802 / IAM 14324 / JCM 22182 / KY 12970) TaxID=764103 RepID=G7DVK2_MIXOS|nr:hypothetical protein E5Q_01264 [Mixia osmundae IAM 14324]
MSGKSSAEATLALLDDEGARPPDTSIDTVISTTAGPWTMPMMIKARSRQSAGSYSSAPSSSSAASSISQAGSTSSPAITPNGAQASREARNLVQHHQAHIRENPYEFMRQLGAYAQGTGWRSYEHYVGSRVLYEGYTADVTARVLNSAAVRSRIKQLAQQRLDQLDLPRTQRAQKINELEQQLFDVATETARKMIARLDSVQFFKFFGATVNNILVRMYHQGIHISLDEFTVFRQVAQEAAEKKISLLMLPCHKSHIDYLTVSFLCYRLGISIPHIVAGENLDMPVVGPMLQKCGAFYIRRSFGDDALYPVVIREYIEQLLSTGHNLECFIEGTRSRTGKLLPPKLGILKYVLEAVQTGRTADVMICPISVQYDKVIETDSYVNELLGNPKEKESIWGLIANTRVLQLKMGRIDVRFQKPYSLKGFIEDQVVSRKRLRQDRVAFDPANNNEHKVMLLKALGYQVLSDINKVSVIMPAALVGTVILTLRGRGVGRNELVRRVDTLREKIISRGGRVAEFGGMTTEEVVDRALEALKDLIGVYHDLMEPTVYPLKRFDLSFHRNQVIHIFVSEVKAGGAVPGQRMEYNFLLAELGFLSQTLKNEFVYGTEGMVQNAENTIEHLQTDQVILVEDDMIGLSPAERARGRENFETYWLAAVSLFGLTPLKNGSGLEDDILWLPEREFHKRAQVYGKTLHAQGDVSYLEAVNQATMSNAFQRYHEMGIIIARRSKNAKSVAMMALHPEWTPRRDEAGVIRAEGKLWSFLERLGSFRRLVPVQPRARG